MKSSPWVVCCVALLCLQYVRSEGDSGEFTFDEEERHRNENYDDLENLEQGSKNANPINYCKMICGTDPGTKCDDPYKEKELKDCGCHDSWKNFIPSTKRCQRQCYDGYSMTRCRNEGQCVDTGKYKYCECVEGTTGDYCEIIPECSKSLKSCVYGRGNCVFKDGRPTCKCALASTKFYEKGGYCDDQCTKDEDCTKNPWIDERKFCNTDGFCACPEGLDGYDCQDVPGCYELYDLCKEQNAECVYDKYAKNKATCKCNEEGFTYEPDTKQCKRN